jgi:hypothetical protein
MPAKLEAPPSAPGADAQTCRDSDTQPRYTFANWRVFYVIAMLFAFSMLTVKILFVSTLSVPSIQPHVPRQMFHESMFVV